LSTLSAEEARHEVQESKRILEEQLGAPVRTFAYPSGRKEDYNRAIRAILEETGYSCAVTSVFGVNEKGQDPFELRRGTPWEPALATFAMKLNWYKFDSCE
jgi:peptidoglycan/xylan/chitin deacetylase (PgdA/CDA1 family)